MIKNKSINMSLLNDVIIWNIDVLQCLKKRMEILLTGNIKLEPAQ